MDRRIIMEEENKIMPYSIRNWGITQFFGVIMILIGFCLTSFFFIFPSLTILIIVFMIILLVIGMQIIYAGIIGKEFQQIVQTLPLEDVQFNMLRLTMRFSFNGRIFFILFHALAAPSSSWLLPAHGILWIEYPEHYQIWTQVPWSAPIHQDPYDLKNHIKRSGIKGTLFKQWVQPEPPENPLSDELEGYHSPLLCEIQSLCFTGLAKRGGSPILFAILRRDAQIKEIIQTIHELGRIGNMIQDKNL